jgi:hypothetical protein
MKRLHQSTGSTSGNSLFIPLRADRSCGSSSEYGVGVRADTFFSQAVKSGRSFSDFVAYNTAADITKFRCAIRLIPLRKPSREAEREPAQP